MSSSEIAVNKFKDGYNCAQSVLFGLSHYTGISDPSLLKVATAFGAGMGRTQSVCGAVSGGILALNFIYGRGDGENSEKQEEAYSKTRELISEFEKCHSTTICKELLDGCDLQTERGQDQFNSEDLIERCYECVRTSVKIVETIIQKNNDLD